MRLSKKNISELKELFSGVQENDQVRIQREQDRRVFLCAAGTAMIKGNYGVPRENVRYILGDMLIIADDLFRDETALTRAMVECGLVHDGSVDEDAGRDVLCSSCLMGDQVSSGAYDCDAIDGLTGGKTSCEYYRARTD